MARISAHGKVVGTVETLTGAKRYMSDGVVLKNIGFGWKLAGKLKAGLTPAVAYENAQRRLDESLAGRPAVAAYRAELHRLAGLGKRWKLHGSVERCLGDACAVYDDCCDGSYDAVKASVAEIAALCAAYRAAAEPSTAREAF